MDSLFKDDPNCIKAIPAGIGRDDDIGDFWDYVYTLINMKEIFHLSTNLKSPYTIISSKNVKIEANNGNHIQKIAKEVIEIPNFQEIPNFVVKKGDIYVSEYDYIISLPWIKEWKIEDLEFDYLKLEKDGRFVSTCRYGELTLIGR